MEYKTGYHPGPVAPPCADGASLFQHFKTELSQKIEDSRKNIPEWKKNLLKQKEMKKTGQNFQNVILKNIYLL